MYNPGKPLSALTMLPSLKKTSYYNFIPTKAEEEVSKAAATTGHPYKASRVLVEIRDVYPPPLFDPLNPWRIKKVLTPAEVTTGKIVLSFADTFDCVFRYWAVEAANQVAVVGRRWSVVMWDVSDEKNPTSYVNEDMFLERGRGHDSSSDHEFYVLGCMELVRGRRLNAGDEIGLYWEINTATFHFKILRRLI